jgi:hypothetical protein
MSHIPIFPQHSRDSLDYITRPYLKKKRKERKREEKPRDFGLSSDQADH